MASTLWRGLLLLHLLVWVFQGPLNEDVNISVPRFCVLITVLVVLGDEENKFKDNECRENDGSPAFDGGRRTDGEGAEDGGDDDRR